MSASGGDIEIAVNAAGAEQTEQDLEQVEQRVNETGDSMEGAAGGFQELSRRFQGIGATLIGALATMVTGLLTQVPAVQERMSALGAVVDALAFRLDRPLRSALGGTTNDLFEFADALFEGEGELSEFGDLLGGVLQRLGAFDPTGFTTNLGILLEHWDVIWADIVQTVEGINWMQLGSDAVNALIDGLLNTIPFGRQARMLTGAFVGRWGDTDWVGLGKDITVGIVDGVTSGSMAVLGGARDLIGDIHSRFSDTNWAQIGIDIIEWIADGIRSAVGAVTDAVGDVTDAVVSNLPGFVQAELGVSATGTAAGGGGVGGGTSGAAFGFGADRSGGRPVISMDGRRLTRTDSRFRRDGTARRNRNA